MLLYYIMTKNTPIITVTCVRDLPLLDLQAQSIFHYLDRNMPVYLIVNEEDPTEWFTFFDQHLRHYYQNHTLTVLTRNNFKGAWNTWIASNINPWAVGWETQQVLKLVVAEYIKEPQYLILDSQNFLIREWSTEYYDSDKTPARPGHFVMPTEIWKQYSKNLNIDVELPTSDTMSICTPIFFNTDVVKQLIEHTGDYENFALWFKNASRIKSEFILYALWLEKQGGLSKFHKMFTVPEDWGNPMLRDCNSAEEFDFFIGNVGIHYTHAWVSANHRAWGNMTDEQYQKLCDKLKTYMLVPHFTDYRTSYVDLKI
jgi:hypothetical protein